MQNHDQDFAVN